MDKEYYTLKEASKELEVPVYTVRRLCRAGLIRGIRRKRNGYRILDVEQLDLLRVFVRMLKAGFTVDEMKKYARLQRQGGEALEECKRMLETQKRQLWLQIQNAQEGIDFIERTIEVIDGRDGAKL